MPPKTKAAVCGALVALAKAARPVFKSPPVDQAPTSVPIPVYSSVAVSPLCGLATVPQAANAPELAVPAEANPSLAVLIFPVSVHAVPFHDSV